MESDRLKREEELRRLGAENSALEDEAGISALIAEAREPISGWGMEEASPDEYFAETHDNTRKKTRDAYFSVQDVSLRKRLIAADRRFDRARKVGFEADYLDAVKLLGIAEERANKKHWGRGATAFLASIGAGAFSYGAIGAVGGAIAGYFFAKWFMEEGAAAEKANVVRLQGDVKMEDDLRKEVSMNPSYFTESEEITGERDEAFDLESAWGNYLRSKRQ